MTLRLPLSLLRLMRTPPPAAQPPGEQKQNGDTGKSQPGLPAARVTSRESDDAADKESSDQEAGTYSHTAPEPVLRVDAPRPWFHCHRRGHLPLTELPKQLQKVRAWTQNRLRFKRPTLQVAAPLTVRRTAASSLPRSPGKSSRGGQIPTQAGCDTLLRWYGAPGKAGSSGTTWVPVAATAASLPKSKASRAPSSSSLTSSSCPSPQPNARQ